MTVADDGIMKPRGGMGYVPSTEVRAAPAGMSPAEAALLGDSGRQH